MCVDPSLPDFIPCPLSKKVFYSPPPAEKDGRRSKTFPSRESSYLIHGAVELAIGTVQIAILALVPGVVRAFHS